MVHYCLELLVKTQRDPLLHFCSMAWKASFVFTLSILGVCRLGVKSAGLHEVYSPAIAQALKSALQQFEQKLPGFVTDAGLLHGVETRTSSPVCCAVLAGLCCAASCCAVLSCDVLTGIQFANEQTVHERNRVSKSRHLSTFCSFAYRKPAC